MDMRAYWTCAQYWNGERPCVTGLISPEGQAVRPRLRLYKHEPPCLSTSISVEFLSLSMSPLPRMSHGKRFQTRCSLFLYGREASACMQLALAATGPELR